MSDATIATSIAAAIVGEQCDPWGAHKDTEYRATIMVNGKRHVAIYCTQCGKKISTGWLAHTHLRKQGIEIDQLVVHEDRRVTQRAMSCERCGGGDGVELHHWAPQSLFRDPWDWPTSHLCVSCHREWHQTTGCALAGGRR